MFSSLAIQVKFLGQMYQFGKFFGLHLSWYHKTKSCSEMKLIYNCKFAQGNPSLGGIRLHKMFRVICFWILNILDWHCLADKLYCHVFSCILSKVEYCEV